MKQHVYAVDLNLTFDKPDGFFFDKTKTVHVVAENAERAVVVAKDQTGTVTGHKHGGASGVEYKTIPVTGATAHQVRHKCTLGVA